MNITGKLRRYPIIISAALFIFLLLNIAPSIYNIDIKSIKNDKNAIIKIKDKRISYSDYKKEYLQVLEQLRAQYNAEDSYLENRAHHIVLNNLKSRYALDSLYKKLGINVTEEEMAEIIAGNAMPEYILKDNKLINPKTGEFDRDAYLSILKSMANSPSQNNYLISRERKIKDLKYKEKLGAIYSGCMRVNDIDYRVYEKLQEEISCLVFKLPYNLVGENNIDFIVTKDDKKLYWDEHSQDDEYKRGENVDYQIITIPIEPSVDDVNNTREKLNKFKKAFMLTNNPLKFARDKSDNIKELELTWSESTLPDFLRNIDVVSEPILDGNTFKLYRFIEKKKKKI